MYIPHRRTVAAVEEPDSIVRMPNEEVVGGHMKFKSKTSLICTNGYILEY